MADSSSDEKTEDATPKRLREARKKGQVAKSKDLTTVLEMVAFFAVFCMSLGFISGVLEQLLKLSFSSVGESQITPQLIFDVGKSSLFAMAKASAPALISAFFAALFVGFMQVGPLFTLDPLTPKLEKLNPLEGIKNMFKATTFIELVKNILKMTFIFLISYQVVSAHLGDIIATIKVGETDGAAFVKIASMLAGEIIYKIVLRILILFTVIAVIDYMVQRWQFMKQMRMSKDEVKREYKQDEGDPHIKSHRKALHREFVFGDVGQQVKNADAVVTNPTHVAIAIQYNREEMGAPQVVAKGQRLFAENIKKIAEENGVPIIRNVALAWSLLEVEMGDEVPEELYAAVAEILAIVYKMKQNQ